MIIFADKWNIYNVDLQCADGILHENYHSFNKSFVEPRLFGLSTWYVTFESVFADDFSFPDDVSDAVLFEADLYLPNFSPKASVNTEGLEISYKIYFLFFRVNSFCKLS